MRYGPAIIGVILIAISLTVYLDGATGSSSCLDCSSDAALTRELYGVVFGIIGAVIFLLGVIGGRKSPKAT